MIISAPLLEDQPVAAACLLACIAPSRIAPVPLTSPKPIVLEPVLRDLLDENWRKAIVQFTATKQGLFFREKPEKQVARATTCAVAPNKPYPPAWGRTPKRSATGWIFPWTFGEEPPENASVASNVFGSHMRA